MAGYSTLDSAIEGLKNLIISCSDEKRTLLEDMAVEKIQKLTSEIEEIYYSPMERIKRGFIDFRVNDFMRFPKLYEELAQGQEPKFLVFGCSDSRVSPTFILKFIPGDAFMARNIANLVPSFDLDKTKNSGVGAIIEYAVTALKVKNILVIGHSLCGGIQRLMTMDSGSHSYDFIDDWVKIGTPAKNKVNSEHPDKTQEERNKLCEVEAVKMSLENLMSYPYVKNNGNLNLMGGYYDFVHGHLMVWPMDSPDCPMHIPPPHHMTLQNI